MLFLDKHYKNLEYGPRNGQVMPSLGLELKNIGKKMDQKRAKTAVYQKKLQKKEKKL